MEDTSFSLFLTIFSLKAPRDAPKNDVRSSVHHLMIEFDLPPTGLAGIFDLLPAHD